MTDLLQPERRTLAEGRARLGGAQKPNRGAPPYSRWINRRLGRIIALGAWMVGLTPNAVTGISALFTFTALALIALVHPAIWLGPAVAALLMLGYAFDSADGQLARLRGGGSRLGEWLDHMVDVTKTCVLHAVVLVSLWRFGGIPSPWLLVVPLVYLTVAVVTFFGQMLTDQLRRAATAASVRPAVEASPRAGALQTIVALPVDYGVLCVAFALFGWRPGFLVVYGLLCAAHAVVLVGVLARWARQLAAIDAASTR